MNTKGTTMRTLLALALALTTACLSDDEASIDASEPDAGTGADATPVSDAGPAADAHPSEVATRELYRAECEKTEACGAFTGEELAARTEVCTERAMRYRCERLDCAQPIDEATLTMAEWCIGEYEEISDEAQRHDYLRCGINGYPAGCYNLIPHG